MTKKEVKAIIFDIGGVLQLGRNPKIITNSSVHEQIAKKLKISLDQYLDAIDSTYAKSIEGSIPEKRALETIARNLKISILKLRKIYIRAYRKNFKFNKQLFKRALKLKKAGYKIAILSDQWYISRDAFVDSRLRKNFSPLVISCDSGLRKPNPKIYRLILKKLHLSPHQTLFIDNQQWNTKPAEKLGIHTILFKNNKQLFKQLEKVLR